MAGFDFDTVWAERRIFRVGDVEIPVAHLLHIVESKRQAGRDRDRLFLATHAETIRDLMSADRAGASPKARDAGRGRRPAGRRRPRRR
jgi:hypothetical protein